ncbi:uncharacterized protein LOC110626072 [Manihot esculenta]|uniref:Uncharacterized protein n=1 Tax=Manihot esculenta TaxID=3983 RepID=A0A2C9WGK6_MANES|nr:uncharacterized protein LOC110626072 [Manihot esculenta]OAY59117.1 hypothetical protein MANES_01G005536v8 [Manihot esculenta]
MQIVKSLSGLSHSHLYNLLLNPKQPPFPSFSSFAKISKTPNPALFQFLIETFNFSETQALTLSARRSSLKSLENAQSVVNFFKNLGVSNSQIQSAAHLFPQIIFANPDKTLAPKIKVFQDLGIVGHDLGKLISKSSPILGASLTTKLVPCVEILQKHLLNDKKNKDLVTVLIRCYRIVTCKNPQARLLSSIAYLESCGIVGSQLSFLLINQPRLLACQESVRRGIVSQTLSMGFSAKSRMLVYGLIAVFCSGDRTVERKYRLFRSFGYSEYECRQIFGKAPYLLTRSEEKLKLKIKFFLNTVKLEKENLVRYAPILMQSMERRVLPRFRVWEILKSKKFLEEKVRVAMFFSTEEVFVQKYISSFPDEAEELLLAYKGHTWHHLQKKKDLDIS